MAMVYRVLGTPYGDGVPCVWYTVWRWCTVCLVHRMAMVYRVFGTPYGDGVPCVFSQQQFVDVILNTGLLLYVSRTWLTEVFHHVITKDLFTSLSADDTQVLTTLLCGIIIIIIIVIICYYANRQHIHIIQYKIQYKMRNIDYMFTTQQ